MLFKNPLLLETGVATQCLQVLLGHWYLPAWHASGAGESRVPLQMGPPQKQVWPGHTVGPHGRRGMHSAGNGMELAQPVLVSPSVPSWGGLGPVLCPGCEMGACG